MERLLAAGLLALVLNLAITAALMALLRRIKAQQIIREQGPESHRAKSGTLTMGGAGFAVALPLALVITGAAPGRHAWFAIAMASACCLIGMADDLAKFIWKKTEGVKARYRFVLQLALGGAAAWYVLRFVDMPTAVRMPFGLADLDLAWAFVPFVIFVFAGTLNSVNFTDGLDGLLGGCTVFVAAAFGLYLARTGDAAAREFLPVLAALAGALGGFLWFNAHPASLFMGDTGSLYIGGLLAAVAIVARAELFLAVAGLLFAAEALSVIIQVAFFRTTGRRVFLMSPIHHHFEKAGWPETRVVARFWIFTAACCAAALMAFAR